MFHRKKLVGIYTKAVFLRNQRQLVIQTTMSFNKVVTENCRIMPDLDRLQEKLETNIQVLEKLLGNYSAELTNLRNSLFQQSTQSCLTSTSLEQKCPDVCKVRPQTLPKPPCSARTLNKGCVRFCQQSDIISKEKIAKRKAHCPTPHETASKTTRTSSDATDLKSLIRKSYDRLVNYLSCTEDIAARLYQDSKLTGPELESVQNAQTMAKANENLLNLVLQKPHDVCEGFLSELRRTRQSHVLSLLTEADGDSFELLHHSKLIRQHYVYLTESLDVEQSGLLNHLVAGKVLSDREKTSVASEWNRYRQVEILLGLIARKPATDYEQFLVALRSTNQKHICDVLQGSSSIPDERPTSCKTVSIDRHADTVRKILQVKPKRVLIGQSCVNFDSCPFSIRLDVSAKVLAICRLSKVHKELEGRGRHIDELLRGFVELRKTVNEVEKDRSHLVEEKERLLLKNTKMKTEIDLFEAALRLSQRETNCLNGELSGKMSNISRLEVRLADSEFERDRLEKQLTDVNAENDRLTARLLNASNEIKTRGRTRLENELVREIRLEKERLEMSLMQKEIDLERERENVLRFTELHNKEMNSVTQELLREDFRKERLIQENERKISDLRTQVENYTTGIDVLRKELERLKMSLIWLEADRLKLIQDLDVERRKNVRCQCQTLDVVSGEVEVDCFRDSHFCRMDIGGMWVEGAVILGENIYLAIRSSSAVIVFSKHKPHNRLYSIKVHGMTGSLDIVACRTNSCLYISDLGGACVWRVGSSHVSEKWLSNVTWPYTLSVTASGRLVLAQRPSSIHVYAPDARLLNNIRLPDSILNPSHAVETPSGTFLVSHGNGLTENHCISELTKEGRLLRSYGGAPGQGPAQLDRPLYLSRDGDNNVVVVDQGNNRILLLDSKLDFVEVLLNRGENETKNPQRFSYCSDDGVYLVVSSGAVDVYKFNRRSLKQLEISRF